MATTAARRLQVVGRSIAVVAVASTLTVVAWYAYELLRGMFFSGDAAWGEVGILPLVFLLRLALAGWVAWAAVELDGHAMLRVLLAAFGVSFLLLFGWYFLLLGSNGTIFYIAVSADLLYLVGALVIGGAIILSGMGPNSPKQPG